MDGSTWQRKKRICFLTPFGLKRRGTVAHRVLPLVGVLGSQGIRVRVLVAGWDQPEHQGAWVQEKHIDLMMLRFNPALLAAGGRGLMRVWWGMAREALDLIRFWHPDVVVLSKPVTVPLLFLLMTRGLPGRRALRSTRMVLDCDDLERAWTANVPLARAWQWLGRWLEPLAWRLADHVTVASHYLLEEVKKVRQDNAVTWLPNMAPAVDEVSSARTFSTRVVVPTRLLDVSPSTLVATLAAVLDQEPKASLLVVGPDQEQTRTLKRELEAAGLASRVAIVVRQPAESYYRLLHDARVGLYVVEDTPAARAKCPRRLLDLMALGVPTVAVDVGEAQWLLDDTGFVVPPDPATIGDATRIMWRNGEARAYFSQRARARAAAEFGPEATMKRLREAFLLA